MLSASSRCRCVRRAGAAAPHRMVRHSCRPAPRGSARAFSNAAGRRCRPHSFFAVVLPPPAAGALRLADARPRACRARSRSTESRGRAAGCRERDGRDIALDARPRLPIRERIDLEDAEEPHRSSANGVPARCCDCSARRPVIQTAAPASARLSGSTLRMPQQALRASTEARKPLMPCARRAIRANRRAARRLRCAGRSAASVAAQRS